MAHLSHSYAAGASLYFTVLYPLDPRRAVKQWAEIKREATDSVLGHGGTLSHHHGVGRSKAPKLGFRFDLRTLPMRAMNESNGS